MDNSIELTAKIAAIQGELAALKSKQNLAPSGLEVPAAHISWSGRDEGDPGPQGNIITFRLRVTFTPETTGFVPLSFLAYRFWDSSLPPFTSMDSRWFEPRILSLENNHIQWLIESTYYAANFGRDINISGQVFSLVPGTATVERIL